MGNNGQQDDDKTNAEFEALEADARAAEEAEAEARAAEEAEAEARAAEEAEAEAREAAQREAEADVAQAEQVLAEALARAGAPTDHMGASHKSGSDKREVNYAFRSDPGKTLESQADPDVQKRIEQLEKALHGSPAAGNVGPFNWSGINETGMTYRSIAKFLDNLYPPPRPHSDLPARGSVGHATPRTAPATGAEGS